MATTFCFARQCLNVLMLCLCHNFEQSVWGIGQLTMYGLAVDNMQDDPISIMNKCQI